MSPMRGSTVPSQMRRATTRLIQVKSRDQPDVTGLSRICTSGVSSK